MKIRIDIDLQPSNTAELESLAKFVKSLDNTLSAIEVEIDQQRRRLERVEETTTRFEPSQEEN